MTIAHKQLTESQRGHVGAAPICGGVRQPNWNAPIGVSDQGRWYAFTPGSHATHSVTRCGGQGSVRLGRSPMRRNPVAKLARSSGDARFPETRKSMGSVRHLLCQHNRRPRTAGGEIEICLETRFFGYLFFLVCCWESMHSPVSKLTSQGILRSEPRMGSLERKWRVVCWIRRDCRL